MLTGAVVLGVQQEKEINSLETQVHVEKKQNENLLKDKADLEKTVEGLFKKVSEQEEDINKKQKTIEEKDSDIVNKQKEIDNLNKDLNKTKKELEKKVSVSNSNQKYKSSQKKNKISNKKKKDFSSEESGWKTITVNASAYTMVANGDSMGGTGLTSTGKVPTANHTIAVDPSVIPYGSKIKYNGVVYTAEDTGGVIDGYKVDIFMNTLKECQEFGRRNISVQVKYP